MDKPGEALAASDQNAKEFGRLYGGRVTGGHHQHGFRVDVGSVNRNHLTAKLSFIQVYGFGCPEFGLERKDVCQAWKKSGLLVPMCTPSLDLASKNGTAEFLHATIVLESFDAGACCVP